MSQVETYSQKIARWRNAEASSMRALKNQMPRIYNRIHNADTGSQQLKYPLENEQDYGGYITFTAKQEAPKESKEEVKETKEEKPKEEAKPEAKEEKEEAPKAEEKKE